MQQDTSQYRPHDPASHFRIQTKKYTTSLDPRGYIPVYEYVLDGPAASTLVMWDRETGQVHFTGIWKALGNSKGDIAKVIDSNPGLNFKKIRGGYLKIQGTWIHYHGARFLALRTCYAIRHQLIPLFGPTFPDECVHPSNPEFGCLVLPDLLVSSAVLPSSTPSLFQNTHTFDIVDNNKKCTIRDPRRSSPTFPHRYRASHPYLPFPTTLANPTNIIQPLHSMPTMSPSRSKHFSPRGMEMLLNNEDERSKQNPTEMLRSFSAPVCSRESSVSFSCNSMIFPSGQDIPMMGESSQRARPSVRFVPESMEGNDRRDTMTCSSFLEQLSREQQRGVMGRRASLPQRIQFGGRDYRVVFL
ncbi:uncharacterized protein VTP21DRAFT_7933 [Calcarisporiella thermophila]|uniref:uncharacterized protein n=1 Tax=Calcarisporiella thermophila TaxID=911321 RepID=UPI0037440337